MNHFTNQYHCLLTLLIGLLPATLLYSQNPSSVEGGQTTQTVTSRESNKEPAGSPLGNQSDFLGQDVPFFNPGNEILSWDGKNWQISNNRVFQARFEKYLNAPAATTEDDQEYRALLEQITDLLAPGQYTPKRIDEAFSLLPQASNYQIDANLCDSIADAVYSIWLARSERARLRAANQNLEEQLKQHEWNAKMVAEDVSVKLTGDADNKQNRKQQRALQNDLRVEPYIRRKVEVLALMEANKIKREATLLQSKIEFQSLLVQHFLQRRFQHVLIGTRFYRAMFSDGDTLLRVEGDAKDLFASTTGMPPTVAVLDSLANEMIRDVREGVDSYNFLLDKNELESATKRLGEAFVIGEYLPPLRTLTREKKRRALEFTQLSNQLISALEVKDYTLAEENVNKLKTIAKDFDPSKALAAIETARTVSAMHLAKAKNAAVSGDRETLETELRAATEIWPRNPDLAEVSAAIFSQSDTQMQALADLERLYSQKNFRQIYEDQVRFIAAAAMYPEKQETLTQVLRDMQKIETAIIQAQEMARHGDSAGAWEQTERMFKEFPDDNKLNQLRAELTTKAADFVATLRQAEQLEAEERVGSSLAWYLKARQLYPNSSYAHSGIDRLVEVILPEADRGDEPSLVDLTE